MKVWPFKHFDDIGSLCNDRTGFHEILSSYERIQILAPTALVSCGACLFIPGRMIVLKGFYYCPVFCSHV
jgi:hypothetical protein